MTREHTELLAELEKLCFARPWSQKALLDEVDYETILSGSLDRLIESRATDYREPFPGAREKVMNAAKLILTYYAASLVKVRADRLYEQAVEPVLKV